MSFPRPPAHEGKEFEVPFYEGFVTVVIHLNKRWVSIKRICENLRLAYPAQLQKLKKADWATVSQRGIVARDNKHRKTAILPFEQLARWLGQIELWRLDEETRPALERYQSELTRVIAAYFGGTDEAVDFDKYRRRHRQGKATGVNVTEETNPSLIAEVRSLRQSLDEVGRDLATVEEGNRGRDAAIKLLEEGQRDIRDGMLAMAAHCDAMGGHVVTDARGFQNRTHRPTLVHYGAYGKPPGYCRSLRHLSAPTITIATTAQRL